jgi:hypothetical protein
MRETCADISGEVMLCPKRLPSSSANAFGGGEVMQSFSPESIRKPSGLKTSLRSEGLKTTSSCSPHHHDLALLGCVDQHGSHFSSKRLKLFGHFQDEDLSATALARFLHDALPETLDSILRAFAWSVLNNYGTRKLQRDGDCVCLVLPL